MQKRKKGKWRTGSQMRIGMDLGIDESLTEVIGEGEERKDGGQARNGFSFGRFMKGKQRSMTV